MRPKLIALIFFTLMIPFVVGAGQQPPTRIRVSELERMPFIVGTLKITITEFRGSVLKLLAAYIEVRVENTSTEFATFSPQRLVFVNKDNEQTDILGIRNGTLPALDKSIAPGARIKQSYVLTEKVRLPARLYYNEKLLAVIAE